MADITAVMARTANAPAMKVAMELRQMRNNEKNESILDTPEPKRDLKIEGKGLQLDLHA